jgi:hypothetical protein
MLIQDHLKALSGQIRPMGKFLFTYFYVPFQKNGCLQLFTEIHGLPSTPNRTYPSVSASNASTYVILASAEVRASNYKGQLHALNTLM